MPSGNIFHSFLARDTGLQKMRIHMVNVGCSSYNATGDFQSVRRNIARIAVLPRHELHFPFMPLCPQMGPVCPKDVFAATQSAHTIYRLRVD